MIDKVVKYLIVGLQSDQDAFFAKAQEEGFLEFISVTSKKQALLPEKLQVLMSAIKVLSKQVPQNQHTSRGDLSLALNIAEKTQEIQEELLKYEEEQRGIKEEIKRVAPLGNFSVEDIAYIEKEADCKLQFYFRKGSKQNGEELKDLVYITKADGLEYYLGLSKNLKSYKGFSEMRIDSSLLQLNNRLRVIESSIKDLHIQMRESAAYLNFLHEIFLEEMDAFNLLSAKKDVQVPLENGVFTVEAWIPQKKASKLIRMAKNEGVYVEEVRVEAHEKTPTYLENKGISSIGEDLVKIYDIPSTEDSDPSTWIVWFFALFFAVILSDGGYGLIFLSLALYLKYKFPALKGQKKRLLKLLFVLSGFTIAWGCFLSSYFGMKISPESPSMKYSPLYYLVEKKADYHLNAKDDVYKAWAEKFPAVRKAASGRAFILSAKETKKEFSSYKVLEEFSGNILLEFTLLVGVLHLTFGFLRYIRRNLSGLGWILFMIGGFLYFPHFLKATSFVNFLFGVPKDLAGAFGCQLMNIGIFCALAISFIRKGLKGWSEITNLVQVFADVLSYLRLYALSLAGSIMASTFNQEGSQLGLAIGALAIGLGHVINITLGVMGGVIHGLRLNFLEWYHYCFDGGGRLFNPLKKNKRSS